MGAISVVNLGKAYKQYKSRSERLLSFFAITNKPSNLNWVLKDISFTVGQGESLGIVGMNGAGKSTLLKLITGTVAPTSGEVLLRGKVAAMLELGMGFHPDFTGRQNVIMAAQLLGFNDAQITELFPSIEAFAEIGSYIDEPIRTYSSGMQVRLAFSVATAIRPDILIIDEALSVGDAYFQHKSFDRIREFRKQGTTLLIVSHDKQAIQTICDRAILLKSGRLLLEGKPEEVMDFYNASLANHQNQTIQQEESEDGKFRTVSGTGEATVSEISLLDEDGKRMEIVDVGQALCMRVVVKVKSDLPRLVFGYAIKDRLGQVVYGTNTYLKGQVLENVSSDSSWVFNIYFQANLGQGTYSIQTALVSSDTHLQNNYEWKDLACMFNVVNMKKPNFAGCSWIDPKITIEKI